MAGESPSLTGHGMAGESPSLTGHGMACESPSLVHRASVPAWPAHTAGPGPEAPSPLRLPVSESLVCPRRSSVRVARLSESLICPSRSSVRVARLSESLVCPSRSSVRVNRLSESQVEILKGLAAFERFKIAEVGAGERERRRPPPPGLLLPRVPSHAKPWAGGPSPYHPSHAITADTASCCPCAPRKCRQGHSAFEAHSPRDAARVPPRWSESLVRVASPSHAAGSIRPPQSPCGNIPIQ
jgi:hypothetical protein